MVKHGEDGPTIAARRCDELLDARDYDGARNDQAIILRINKLLKAQTNMVH